MKKETKEKGITLIALVITIIVLLILAGISISMLSGNNSILEQATRAKTKNTHANVLEQLQLEASAYTIDKNTGVYSNSLIDYLKSKSIISDISGEEDKWLINVTTLLGSNQPKGNGTYPNDVYVLEKQDSSTGSIVNTKVATTMPIKIAATNTSQITYIVKYYENANSEELILGNLFDNDLQVELDESEKLKAYFNSEDSYDSNGDYKDNDTIGVKVSDLVSLFVDGDQFYWLYNDSVYMLIEEEVNGVATITNVIKVNTDLNLNKFGEYTVDGIKVLVDSSRNVYQKENNMNPPAGLYNNINLESQYYYKDAQGHFDYEKPFIGYVVHEGTIFEPGNIIYYDLDGNVVNNVGFGGMA